MTRCSMQKQEGGWHIRWSGKRSSPQKHFGNLHALRKLGCYQRKIDMMTSAQIRNLLFGVFALGLGCIQPTLAQSITRAEALKIAESYVEHRWEPSPRNLLHGKDRDGIEVHTPDRDGGRGSPLPDCWRVNEENIGVPYKWGGLDTPQSFDVGIRAGKAAGDVYTPEKRRHAQAAVSSAAVGVDCSGFICCCWKLTTRYSTGSFASICQTLLSTDALQPADIMNHPGGHVVLFVRWLDDNKKRALFYESAPFSKTLASKRDVNEMITGGYLPMRYRQIRND
jgi:hypothetical protein